MTTPARERSFVYDGAAFFRASHGMLTEAWVFGDLDSLRRQLGGEAR